MTDTRYHHLSAVVHPRRIVVLGSPGAGKSQLAIRLAAALDLPLIRLDDHYWEKDWRRPDATAWAIRVQRLAAKPRWVIDGNYQPTLSTRIARAQLAVLVDTPTTICLIRVLRRAWRISRGDPTELPAQICAQARTGSRVRSTKDFRKLLWLVLRYRFRERPHVITTVERSPQAELIRVTWRPRTTADQAVDTILDRLHPTRRR